MRTRLIILPQTLSNSSSRRSSRSSRRSSSRRRCRRGRSRRRSSSSSSSSISSSISSRSRCRSTSSSSSRVSGEASSWTCLSHIRAVQQDAAPMRHNLVRPTPCRTAHLEQASLRVQKAPPTRQSWSAANLFSTRPAPLTRVLARYWEPSVFWRFRGRLCLECGFGLPLWRLFRVATASAASRCFI